MAILDIVPSVSAEILVKGIPATEHPDTDEIQVEHRNPDVAEYQARRTVSTYVESISNDKFAIKFTVDKSYIKVMLEPKNQFAKLGFHVTIDGNTLKEAVHFTRPWFNRKEGKGKTEWTKELEGVKHEASFGKPVTIKAFRFAKIETTGDSAESMVVKSMHQKLRKIGLIEIKVYREKGGQQGAILSALPDGFMEDDERENVPEKAVKGDAKSDCTSLGEAEKGKKGSDTYRNTKKIDGDDKPLIIFRFMYRSREALRQLHIIERTPSPSPAPSRSPSPDPDHIPGPDGKTPFEVRLDKEIENERAKRIAAMEDELAREKTEKQEKAKAMTTGVKRERSDVAMQIKKERGEEASMNAPPAKRPRREFHDLTGDDEDDAFPEGSGGNEGNGE